MRTYEKTHPWLSFTLDLRQIDYTTWLLLGEAASKAEHIAGVPLSPDAADQLHKVYLVKGALASTAIEGNTLTEDEARQHLDGQLALPPSRQYLGQEIDNIVEACNIIGRQVIEDGGRNMTMQEIKDYNALVLRGLPVTPDIVPGRLRRHSVVVGRYRGAPAEDCEYLLDRFCQWLNELDFPEQQAAPFSILAAIVAHLYFVWIHPFGDGNGRTARLIEFRYLLQAGLPTPAAHLLSNFYNSTRTEYYRQLDQASKSGGDMAGFIAYAAQGLVDQLSEQLAAIRDLQWRTTWRNYVYEQFPNATAVDLRRRELVLGLSRVTKNDGWVNVLAIPELTPRLAREYASKTAKTLSRDLNALAEMKLIGRSSGRVRANRKIILAFLPARVANERGEPQAAARHK